MKNRALKENANLKLHAKDAFSKDIKDLKGAKASFFVYIVNLPK